TGGGLYRAAVAQYSDRDYGQFSFRRYEVEGLRFVALKGDAWIVALHGWGVFSQTTGGNEVPFYMAPSLGGNNTLRGYRDYRFHVSMADSYRLRRLTRLTAQAPFVP